MIIEGGDGEGDGRVMRWFKNIVFITINNEFHTYSRNIFDFQRVFGILRFEFHEFFFFMKTNYKK